MSASSRNNRLAQAFAFSEADLQLNREGRLSEGQKKAVASARKARMASMIAYAVFLGLFVLGILGVGVSLLVDRSDSTIRLAIMLGLGVASLMMAGGAVNFYVRSRDVISGTIRNHEGTAKLFTRHYAATYAEIGGAFYGTGWFLRLGSKQFRILYEKGYAAFDEGQRYRVYYVKNYPFDVILSAEAL